MANSSSEIAPNFVQILWISQSCPNRGYSQWITTRLIFGFCHTISPPVETPNNDWLNPIDLFINIRYAISPDLKRFCNPWSESCISSGTAYFRLIHILSPIVWNLDYGGKSYSTRALQYAFKVSMVESGLPRYYSIHSLRHSYGTYLYQRTKDLRLVQKQLGHSSITILPVTHYRDNGLKTHQKEGVFTCFSESFLPEHSGGRGRATLSNWHCE